LNNTGTVDNIFVFPVIYHVFEIGVSEAAAFGTSIVPPQLSGGPETRTWIHETPPFTVLSDIGTLVDFVEVAGVIACVANEGTTRAAFVTHNPL
jgi:hypothetical protein